MLHWMTGSAGSAVDALVNAIAFFNRRGVRGEDRRRFCSTGGSADDGKRSPALGVSCSLLLAEKISDREGVRGRECEGFHRAGGWRMTGSAGSAVDVLSSAIAFFNRRRVREEDRRRFCWIGGSADLFYGSF